MLNICLESIFNTYILLEKSKISIKMNTLQVPVILLNYRNDVFNFGKSDVRAKGQ